MIRRENGRAVWFTAPILEGYDNTAGTELHNIRSYPQDVDNFVENPASACGKADGQPMEKPCGTDGKRKIVHGFSTKHGGVSTLAHISDLNFGFSVGEDRETTLENYRCFAHTLGIDPGIMLCANQTHSTRVLTADASLCGMGLSEPYAEALCGTPDADAAEGGFDGLVSASPGTALVVRIADCVPILFCDPVHAVIGACHAGWRGTVGGIAAKTADAMCALGAEKSCIRAAIGPAVGVCCYEIDDGFYNTFLGALGADICGAVFRRSASYENPDRRHCDLPACNRLLLLAAGLLPAHIETAGMCTCCHPELFHSHRYAQRNTGGVRGLMAACIALL